MVSADEYTHKCPSGHRHRSHRSAEFCSYCARIRRGPGQYSGDYFSTKRYKIPQHVNPLVKFLFEEMLEQRCQYKDMAARSGVSEHTIRSWATRVMPTLENVEACLNVLGRRLTTVKIKQST